MRNRFTILMISTDDKVSPKMSLDKPHSQIFHWYKIAIPVYITLNLLYTTLYQ